jgi:hypothetical protein
MTTEVLRLSIDGRQMQDGAHVAQRSLKAIKRDAELLGRRQKVTSCHSYATE